MDQSKKETFNITSIPPNAQVTITVGGLFYQRLNKLLIDWGDSVDHKTLLAAMYRLKQGTAEKDPYAFNLETLIILLKDVEEEFRNTGQAIEQEVTGEIPEGMQQIRDELGGELDKLKS